MTKDCSKLSKRCVLSDMIGKHFKARDMQMKRQFFAKTFRCPQKMGKFDECFSCFCPRLRVQEVGGVVRLAWERIVHSWDKMRFGLNCWEFRREGCEQGEIRRVLSSQANMSWYFARETYFLDMLLLGCKLCKPH